MDPYISFNKALKEFIKCSIERFPHVKELKMMLMSYKMLKTLSKKRPCKLFKSITHDCQDSIMNKDESYFLQYGCDSSSIADTFNATIHKEWDQMTDDDKNAIWQHLQVLVLLSHKCQII